ncbi:MAG: bifunctional hydroxymethylpyrimidine kinase/phosphomethylpyrimidine kinase, partial [Bacteroidota bacterium]|nr:bifunctional hydroxymethylpyrimidine kinase/phosphomethylpyrimidine kinase [Bacteroidota bacterium]
MTATRPYILTIAGFDPSGGAGILSDIKTIEANGGYGLGVLSANTWQNDIAFEKVEWVSLKDMQAQINILTSRFNFKYIKIGIVQNLAALYELLLFLRKKIPDAIIV